MLSDMRIRHKITIRDYQFSVDELQVQQNDVLEFHLDEQLPLHAEHLIHGVLKTQDKSVVLFESPLMTVVPFYCILNTIA
jgi:hypothetical protein